MLDIGILENNLNDKVSYPEYLRAFGYDDRDEVNLRFFYDPERGKKAGKEKAITQFFDKILPRLNRYNGMNCGIFLVVNSGGQKAKDIRRCNAFFIEIDEGSFEEQLEKIKAFPIEPTIIIRTKKSLHVYWIIEGGLLDRRRWRAIQYKLINHFGSDEEISDPSRVMRLYGFYHCKDPENKVLVKLLKFDQELKYSVSQFEELDLPELTAGQKKNVNRTPKTYEDAQTTTKPKADVKKAPEPSVVLEGEKIAAGHRHPFMKVEIGKLVSVMKNIDRDAICLAAYAIYKKKCEILPDETYEDFENEYGRMIDDFLSKQTEGEVDSEHYAKARQAFLILHPDIDEKDFKPSPGWTEEEAALLQYEADGKRIEEGWEEYQNQRKSESGHAIDFDTEISDDIDYGTAVKAWQMEHPGQKFNKQWGEAKEALQRAKENNGQVVIGSGFSNDDWMRKLISTEKGLLKSCPQNCRLILENDINLKNIAYNSFTDSIEVTGSIPWAMPAGKQWRDADDSQLLFYIIDHYADGASMAKEHVITALSKVTDDRRFHPIQRYFENLPEWDGIPRASSVIIDYLGADDNEYTRTVTKKILSAAYRRIYSPGIKFDYMLVLIGNQGIGKSTLIEKLGKGWYSDSLTISDILSDVKAAGEKLEGYWMIEIPELAGIDSKRFNPESLKSFLSRKDDKYRPTYGRRTAAHPRQCVIWGTTNKAAGFLRDTTGNRRFWNVYVSGEGKYKPWDLTDNVIDQIWAEVKKQACRIDDLHLSTEIAEQAEKMQKAYMEENPLMGIIEDFLMIPLPDNWDELDLQARRKYLKNPDGDIVRTKVCCLEIWCECLGHDRNEAFSPKNQQEITGVMEQIGRWKRADERKRFPIYGQQRYFVRT